MLCGIHAVLSALTKVEELELDEKEADKLAKALARLNKLYDGIVLSEKQMAWFGLAVAAGAVYGPRAMAYRLRMKMEATAEKRSKAGPVTIDAVFQSAPAPVATAPN